MKSFIVGLWSKIFGALRWISPFQIFRTLIPTIKESASFVDVWVLGNLLLSIILLSMCSAPNLLWWEILSICYGVIRVCEIGIYQINVLLFDEYRARKARKPYVVRDFRRLVLLLLHNYVEIIIWFALFYRNIDWAFETGGITLDSFLMALNFSFITMTSFGYSTIIPKEALSYILTIIQSAIGLFMALLILARFISLLPEPKTIDESEMFKRTGSQNETS